MYKASPLNTTSFFVGTGSVNWVAEQQFLDMGTSWQGQLGKMDYGMIVNSVLYFISFTKVNYAIIKNRYGPCIVMSIIHNTFNNNFLE